MSSLILKDEGTFERAEAGMHNAVCCDVEDLGMVEVEWNNEKKMQHKINIYWQTEEKKSDGERFLLRKRYTFSMYETAQLRKDLESWRGRQFTPEDLKNGFDVMKLVGVPCTLQIAHETSKNGKTYANVKSVLPYDKRLGEQLKPENYVRPEPKEKTDNNFYGAQPQAQAEVEQVPF